MNFWERLRNRFRPQSIIDKYRELIRLDYEMEDSESKFQLLRLHHCMLKLAYFNEGEIAYANICGKLETIWRNKLYEVQKEKL